MKIFIIIFLLIITACSSNTKQNEINISPSSQSIKQRTTFKEIILGEAYTNIIDKGGNRVNNIMLASKKISGMKITPGEEFSFNKITGEKTINNGYKSAPMLVDGKKSYGIGGGVCQVSTTIYMAAFSSGLKITEHHNHSETVAYASDGMDATVVYGVKDFKFVNNTDADIFIYVWVNDNQVISKIIKKEYKHQ